MPDGLPQRVNITLMDLSKLGIWALDESILLLMLAEHWELRLSS